MRKRSKKTIAIKIAIIVLGLIIIAAIITGIFFLVRHVVSQQAESSSGTLYEKVQNYDYTKGHNEDIEKEIKESLEKNLGAEDSTEYITTLKAKAEYYFGLQKYYTAVTALKELEPIVATGDDMIYLYEHLAAAYDKFGNSDKAAEYQTMYDNLTRKCGGELGEEANKETSEEVNE